MTSDVLPLSNDDPTVGPPPRKRRRRAGGGGATDDCFTCRKRAVKCDRKRPYCTQCIEIGKECSGYKTTLTWGVGVASRGKLRGLSFPIANKSTPTSEASGSAATPKIPKTSIATERKGIDIPSDPNHVMSPQTPQAAAVPPQLGSPSIEMSMQQHQTQWQAANYVDLSPVQSRSDGQRFTPIESPMQRLQTSPPPPHMGPTNGFGSVSSAGAVGSFSDHEFHSPLEYSRTSSAMVTTEPMTRNVSFGLDNAITSAGPTDGFAVRDTPMHSYHHFASSIDSMASGTGMVFPMDDPGSMEPVGSPTYSQIGYPRNDHLVDPMNERALTYPTMHTGLDPLSDEDEPDVHRGISLIDSRFASPFFHLSPRMQTLLEYYSSNVCPYIVAFDGPENPYRQHILQLAMCNEGLQHAIAALSTNNQRMRLGGSIGFVEEMAGERFDGTVTRRDISEPTAEESMHKQMSIDQLNLQLTDTRAAQDDSVLATLLILCLFHVCDSGFSKFKTQLAGVQKLLSLRTVQSDFTRWVEMFFIWFDVMTSTVNDREMQINRESLAMLDYSANLGALEQYSGVDGRLFKLIARLGRLNLLAQGRPVSEQHGPRPTNARMHAARHTKRGASMSSVFSAADYENLDGNGWGGPIYSTSMPDADENEIMSSSTRSAQQQQRNTAASNTPNNNNNNNNNTTTNPNPPFDDRADFWAEWHDVRTRLREWQMDVTTRSKFSGEGQRDMLHINECFRQSALLYTERLGAPLQASSQPQFQQPVAQALYHITALPVSSCVNKFLLWPLFITGTECVDLGHRNIIRLRCRNVMEESGFYNNLSTLEVLERVWSEADRTMRGEAGPAGEMVARRRESGAAQKGKYGQAFRWRMAMDRVDGEYIVI